MFWKKKKPKYTVESYSIFDSIRKGREVDIQEGLDRLSHRIKSATEGNNHIEHKLNKLMDYLELEWDYDRGPRVIPKEKENE